MPITTHSIIKKTERHLLVIKFKVNDPIYEQKLNICSYIQTYIQC